MKEKYNLTESLAIIAKHMKDLINKSFSEEYGATPYTSAHAHDLIGHTQSNKEIYNHPDHPAHADFTPQDHADAAKSHRSFNRSGTAPHREDAAKFYESKIKIPATSQNDKKAN